jgi:hypothetical protein
MSVGCRSCQGPVGRELSAPVSGVVVVLLAGGRGWLRCRAPTLTYATSTRGWVIWRRSGCCHGEGPGVKLVAA